MFSKRLKWLDIAKGIAILLVIVGHTVDFYSPFRDAIFSFHMPLFFILAGYTFRLKPWKEVLVSSTERLIVPYLLIVLVWNVPLLLASPDGFSFSGLFGLLASVVFASGVPVPPPFGFAAIGMPWFLVALFASRLILTALFKLFDRFDMGLLQQGVVCVLLALGGGACSNVLGFYLPASLDVCCYAVLLMWFGFVAKNYGFKPEKSQWPVVILCLVLWVVCVRCSDLDLLHGRSITL